MSTSVWWIRRDLRLADNQALFWAQQEHEHVIPIFVLDPFFLDSPDLGSKRAAFLFQGLEQLSTALQQRGSRLVVRRGEPAKELEVVVKEVGASRIYAEADHTPYAIERDRAVGARLPLSLVHGVTVHPPDSVSKADGSPYTVFTPFSRSWKALPLPDVQSLLTAPNYLPAVPKHVDSVPIPSEPTLDENVPFEPGEAQAQKRLQLFAASGDPPVFSYADQRNRMDIKGTSQLSPYLRFGMLSARQAVVHALSAIEAAPDERARKGAEIWLNELIWREFFISILYHFPQVSAISFRENLRSIVWDNDRKAFKAWQEGRTGYPLVDAAMRQLVATGWMHNRARMVVASFLVKDLLIDWRWGERFFMQHLVDGDPASNNGGWQWTAGTGTDAAPYFRIFNPILQGKKHDPRGVYVRRWVPELLHVPDKYLHTPWEMPAEIQRGSGCVIGRDYPLPIVEHAWARERTLAAYAQAKG